MSHDQFFEAINIQGPCVSKFLHDYTVSSFDADDVDYKPTAFLNKKGRVVVIALVKIIASDVANVVIPANCTDILSDHLKLYAKFSRMTLENSDLIDDFDRTLISVDISLNQPLPWIDREHSGLFTPSCLSLDILGWIDFKKGCYLGQEIVSRMHYKMSKRKKALFCVCSKEYPENIFPKYYQSSSKALVVLSLSEIDDKNLLSQAFL